MRLKEADAFQRLVCRTRSCSPSVWRCLKEADAFQRLVYLGNPRAEFSLRRASKKQTPFSVWYLDRAGDLTGSLSSLKEADAFQRLVFDYARKRFIMRDGLKDADAFQRLVLDSAERLLHAFRASKKQTPFSVWYAGRRR